MAIEPSKISDPELGRFARNEEDGEPRAVIVELSEPPMALPAEREPRPRSPEIRRGVQVEIDAADAGMTRLEGELRRLGLGSNMVRLNHAQAFVVNASPKQLQALLQSPLVGFIRPNRTHRAPRR